MKRAVKQYAYKEIVDSFIGMSRCELFRGMHVDTKPGINVRGI